MDDQRSPVFYDPRQRRWPLVKRLVLILALPVVLVLSMLGASIFDRVELPHLLLPLPPPPPPALAGATPLPPPPPATGLSPRMQLIEDHQRLLATLQDGRRPAPARPAPARPAPLAPVAAPTGQDLRCAFLPAGDARGLAQLKAHGQDLDLVFPAWLHCSGEEALLQEEAPAVQAQALAALTAAKPRLGWMPVVDNCDGAAWDGLGLATALMHPPIRARLCAELVAVAKRVAASGLCIDFQDFAGDLAAPVPVPAAAVRARKAHHPLPVASPGRSRYEALLPFLSELRTALTRQHLQLAVCVPFQRADFPYRSVAALADRVVAVAFDRFAAGSMPGPLAPQKWFDAALAKRLEDVGRERLLLALGNHACDWTLGTTADPQLLASDEALRLARDHHATWMLETSSGNPRFGYCDERQRQHSVWALDAVTAFNHLAAGQQKCCGFALWDLGIEDPTLWNIFPRACALDAAAADSLRHQEVDPPFIFSGEGEVLRVTAALTPGVRELTFHESSRRIIDASWIDFPTPCTVSRWGKAEMRVALTFDDGPHPSWTPAILDILKQEGLHGTFFIVGSQAERFPSLVDRIVAEGHELGNHTFTHPNVLHLTLGQLELELNATQRLIEARTGHQTLLYRAPMGVDSEPKNLEEVRCLEAVNALGYICVGMQLDPNDWEVKDADAIVDEVDDLANREVGNVILLHDGGGDRSATVAALPRLIKELRDDGFTFTTIAGLLGTDRDAVMPPVRSTLGRSLEGWGFWLVHVVLGALEWLFLLGVALGCSRMALIALLAVLEHRRHRRHRFRKGYLPRVAVLVPAYNEEKVVVQTVRSLLASDYRGSLEIVVVDDGSKDQTHRVTQEAFGGRSRIRALTKENGGKALALNFGIDRTTAEVLVAMDADTVFQADAIRLLVRHFGDPRVGAVAGNAKVGNRLNLMTRWQALEYITCQNLDRRAFALVNSITVVPGAVGAWRRTAVMEAGGFTHATLAEDADLTMAIIRQGYRVENEPDAVALTEAPDTVRGFIKQRYRWMFGTIQAAFRHRGSLLELRPLGFIAMPNVIIFGVFFPLISPVMDLMLLLALGSWAWDTWYRDVHTTLSWGVLGWYLAFVAIDHAAAALAFHLEPAEDARLMRWLFLQRFFYRQLMYYVAIKSFLAVLKGQAVGWGKLERKATVAQPQPQPAR